MACKEVKELLSEVLEELTVEQFEKIQNHIDFNGKHTFSPSFEDKMCKLFSRKLNDFKVKQENESSIVNEETVKGRKHVLPGRYLLVAILIMLISSISAVAYGPIKQMLKEIEFYIHDKYISFHVDTDEYENADEEFNKMFFWKPTYVPDEFELIDEHIAITGTSYSLMWINKNEEVLSYTQTNNPSAMIHTSDGNEAIDVTIGANTGKLTKQENGLISIFLEDKRCLFVVAGFIEKDELIRILLSIEPLEINSE